MYDENKKILCEYIKNLIRTTCVRTSAGCTESETVLNNTQPINKVIAHANLLLAVTETVQEQKDGNYRKAYVDFKKGS